MALKAIDLITDAYLEIGKNASEQELSGHMTQTALRRLNNLIYAKSYTIPGYTELSNASDEITSPSYTWRWMTKALAIDLAPQFGQLESYAAIKADEEEAWGDLLIYLQTIPAPQLMGTVPLGAGNKYPGYSGCNFYNETDDGVLSEDNATIAVEDDT